MDRFRIDGHKLMYHVARVNDWLRGKTVYPIYMELSPSGACNQRCSFCALDFLKYQPKFLKTKVLKERLAEMGRLGVKSIMYAGEGEPLLHKDMADIIVCTKESGIDVALTTNGVLMKPDLVARVMRHMEWVKVSCNAATPQTYEAIHGARPGDFGHVMENVRAAVRIKREQNLKCTVGIQLLLLPENKSEVTLLAEMSREMGVDYLVVKPYSQHPSSTTRKYADIRYNEYLDLEETLEAFNTATFSVVFRINTMRNWDDKQRTYARCLALPFWAYIDSGGNVWACSAHLGEEQFNCGNINAHTFSEIWEGEARKRILRLCEEGLDVAQCRINCRMDQVNRYLWELRNPTDHTNFI
jgi:GTP 3',8-cyclase